MMALLPMLAAALALTLPLLLIFRRPGPLVQRREAALALHRAQLAELAREREEGRIGPAEYEGARLEIERRLLTADQLPAQPGDGSARLLLLLLLVVLPLGGFALYLPAAAPQIPSEPHTRWLAEKAAADARLDQLIALLRAHLAKVPPDSADASQGQAYLAEALSEQANTVTPEALALFRQSLANAPPDASWRALDEQRIIQAGGQP